VQLSHAPHTISSRFDEDNLVSAVGLVPVMALAQRAGLSDLVGEHVALAKPGGANAPIKVGALVAGMVAGADSIDDMGLLRHGGMHRIFGGVRAPSTCGTFLRTFTFGHVLQLAAVSRRLLANLTGHAPLLVGADQVSFVDIDDTMKAIYGYAKQGAGYGYNGVKELNALLGTVTTPTGAPLICGALLRKGSTSSARGAARFVASCVHAAQGAGAGRDGGLIVTRGDSAFYSHAVVAAARRAGACFSITARQNRSVQAAIANIDDNAWTPIKYPNAIFDDDEQCWVSDAEVAELDYTAFTSRRKSERVTARLIVRRVKRLNGTPRASGQGVLFDTYRYHAVFTDTPITMLQAESQHRGHAIIEQVHADLRAGALAHLPSGHFQANAAWLQCAVMAFNLTRAAGALAGGLHTKATTASLRAHLISVPARIATSARRPTLHLPRDWPWETGWQQLFDTVTTGPPTATAA